MTLDQLENKLVSQEASDFERAKAFQRLAEELEAKIDKLEGGKDEEEQATKSVLLYVSFKASIHHQEVKLPNGQSVFIRGEIADDDPAYAVDEASPLDGETFLNAVELP